MSKGKKQLLEQTDVALKEIIDGGDETFKAIYREYRNGFLSWAKSKYNIPEDESADIFQEAVIVFYKNVLKGKITRLESSIKTYLFGIGKYMIMKHGQQRKKLVLVEDMNDPLLANIDWTVQHAVVLSPQQELIKEALESLSEICKKIIHLFYYKQFSMEAIKENMGYNTEEVARTSKRKCMRRLEEIIREKLNKKQF